VTSKEIENALNMHPCYNEEAHRKYARMHLPVAPRCNIQCNYCNRKYDCSNESRPGVTSEVLSPLEAVEKVRAVKDKIKELSVVAVAGPGDPLANEETFETFDLIKKEFPELTLCVSTNGLMLPRHAQRLYDLGIRFLTVTVNACDPTISKDIYSSVIWEGKRLTGLEAAERLLTNQLEGIGKCIDLGMVIKINIVMIPGLNDSHIPALVKKMKDMGVYIVNILPLIPVEGTKFSDRRAPTSEERKTLTDLCATDARMMRHCRQCRADAIGLLDNDRSSEFVKSGSCGSGCGPKSESERKRPPSDIIENEELKVAVASTDGKTVNGGFGNANKFRIYASDGKMTRYLETRDVNISKEVYGDPHAKHISAIMDLLKDCRIIIVKEIGPRPEHELTSCGKVLTITDGNVIDSIIESVSELMNQ